MNLSSNYNMQLSLCHCAYLVCLMNANLSANMAIESDRQLIIQPFGIAFLCGCVPLPFYLFYFVNRFKIIEVSTHDLYNSAVNFSV